MGYTEVDLLIDGAEADSTVFEDGQEEERENYEAGIMDLAKHTKQHVEIYTQYHGHDIDQPECICAQYNDNDQKYWTNKTGLTS